MDLDKFCLFIIFEGLLRLVKDTEAQKRDRENEKSAVSRIPGLSGTGLAKLGGILLSIRVGWNFYLHFVLYVSRNVGKGYYPQSDL